MTHQVVMVGVRDSYKSIISLMCFLEYLQCTTRYGKIIRKFSNSQVDLANKYIPVYTYNMKLKDLVQALKNEKINYMIVGGYAVNFHGYSRNTVDIDLVIKFTLSNLKKVEKLLNKMGMVSRLPIDAVSVYKFRDEYIKNRNLIAWNFYNENDPTEQVDILINHDVSDFKSEKFRVNQLELKVITKDDLIKMKKKSGRDKDLLDIKELTK